MVLDQYTAQKSALGAELIEAMIRHTDTLNFEICLVFWDQSPLGIGHHLQIKQKTNNYLPV